MIDDAEMLVSVRRMLEIGLGACRKEMASAKAEDRPPSQVAVECLPWWEWLEVHIDHPEILEVLRQLNERPGTTP